jgi:hypothetical protein
MGEQQQLSGTIVVIIIATAVQVCTCMQLLHVSVSSKYEGMGMFTTD